MKYFIVLILITILLGCELIGVMAALTSAHVYVNKETGALIYCSNKHIGEPRDFRYAGTANTNPKNIKKCFFA